VVVRSPIFRDITLCSQLEVVSEEHVAFIFRIKEYAKQEAIVKAGHMLSCWAYSLTLKMEATCSSKMLTFIRLHAVISQKIELYKNILELLKHKPVSRFSGCPLCLEMILVAPMQEDKILKFFGLKIYNQTEKSHGPKNIKFKFTILCSEISVISC
jgi:hypothetical protein